MATNLWKQRAPGTTCCQLTLISACSSELWRTHQPSCFSWLCKMILMSPKMCLYLSCHFYRRAAGIYCRAHLCKDTHQCCVTNTAEQIATHSQTGFQCWTQFDSLTSNFSAHSHETSGKQTGRIPVHKKEGQWQMNPVFKISREEATFITFQNESASRQSLVLGAVLVWVIHGNEKQQDETKTGWI